MAEIYHSVSYLFSIEQLQRSYAFSKLNACSNINYLCLITVNCQLTRPSEDCFGNEASHRAVKMLLQVVLFLPWRYFVIFLRQEPWPIDGHSVRVWRSPGLHHCRLGRQQVKERAVLPSYWGNASEHPGTFNPTKPNFTSPKSNGRRRWVSLSGFQSERKL